MLVKIYTDASYCPDKKVGGFAFYIDSGKGTNACCGVLKAVENPMDAEMMAITNALHTLRKSSLGRERISFIEIYSDCLGAFKKINKKTTHIIGKAIINELEKLREVSEVSDKRIPIHRLIHVKSHTEFTDKASIGNKYCHDMATTMLNVARQNK
jgi:ribonuclease HI